MKLGPAIAANRFGLGARPGELERIGSDPKRWLLGQVPPPSRTPAALRNLPHSAEVLVALQTLRRGQRELQRRAPADETGADIARPYGRTVREHYIEQASVRYRTAASADLPFHERLVHFWANHFAVSAGKQPLPALAGLFENEAIRPHVSGHFADLLLAAEQHPAMLLYLDNQRSVGPESRLGRIVARRGRRNVGLNENLAREILELHTLGVDGGYTQADVLALANVITGWSIGGTSDNGRFADGKPGHFEFRGDIHQPGTQSILGTRYRQPGLEQGEAVLRDLAGHPSTARFLATKLARHFVADEPPAALVENLTHRYLQTEGNLAAVYEALVLAPEPWENAFGKFKTPHDLVISAFRAFDYVPDNPRVVVAALDLMGQTPFRPGSPAGWPDTAEQWGGADALYKRIEWCNAVARMAGTRANPVELGDAVLGPTFGADARKAISRAESRVQGITLLLAAPHFQRR